MDPNLYSDDILMVQCLNNLWLAVTKLLDFDQNKANDTTAHTLLRALNKIAQLASEMSKPEMQSLANEAVALLRDIQNNNQCIITTPHKRVLFNLLDGIKQHILNHPLKGPVEVD